MGDGGFLDVAIRDRRTRSVLVLDGADTGADEVELTGFVRLQGDVNDSEAISVVLSFSRSDADSLSLTEAVHLIARHATIRLRDGA